jgi:hypothetical protein
MLLCKQIRCPWHLVYINSLQITKRSSAAIWRKGHHVQDCCHGHPAFERLVRAPVSLDRPAADEERRDRGPQRRPPPLRPVNPDRTTGSQDRQPPLGPSAIYDLRPMASIFRGHFLCIELVFRSGHQGLLRHMRHLRTPAPSPLNLGISNTNMAAAQRSPTIEARGEGL